VGCLVANDCCDDYNQLCTGEEEVSTPSPSTFPESESTTSAATTTTAKAEDSCAARGCGSPYNPSRSCQCDATCPQAGDCCSDYVGVCTAPKPPFPPPDGKIKIPGDDITFKVERLPNGPHIYPELFGLDPYWTSVIAGNINGPSLMKVPSWVSNPLGVYYLYFSHHKGGYIRMAYADKIEGPYTIYEPGVLDEEDGAGGDHIASPDMIIDEENQEIRMYYHMQQSDTNTTQLTWVALSDDGLTFTTLPQQLGRPYFRTFIYKDRYYAWSKDYFRGGMMQRGDAEGLSEFEYGNACINLARHTAVWVRGDSLYLFYTRIYDTPETIYVTKIDLSKPWEQWHCPLGVKLMTPEMDWEGADLPISTSFPGASNRRVHELRDPAIYEENGKLYMAYSYAGETGIAIVELIVEAA
jgi:hypothetical protein